MRAVNVAYSGFIGEWVDSYNTERPADWTRAVGILGSLVEKVILYPDGHCQSKLA